MPETLDAIEHADLITFGPGSLFTSIVPNLLVQGIPSAIRRSRALKAYFVNLMWQPGETMGFSASDHVAVVNEHAGLDVLDVAVLNSSPIRPAQRRKYAVEQAQPVTNDIAELEKMGIDVVKAPLLSDSASVRHDPERTAEVVMDLARRGRVRRMAA